MNSASQDFPHHLRVLRERMLHPTAYEKSVSYFLEEFAGDAEFVRASDPEPMPHLVSVLGNVVSKALGNTVKIENALVSHLRAHRFVHGKAGRWTHRVVLLLRGNGHGNRDADSRCSRRNGNRTLQARRRLDQSAAQLRQQSKVIYFCFSVWGRKFSNLE